MNYQLVLNIKTKPHIVSSPFQCVFFPRSKSPYIIMFGHH